MRAASVVMAAAVAGGVSIWLLTGPGPDGDAVAADGDAVAAEAIVEADGIAGADETVVEPARGSGAPRVATLASTAAEVPRTLTLRGVTEAARSVDVRAQVGGLIVSEPLAAGATVAAGDLLCRIEIGERAADLADAQAALAQAETDASASETLSRRGFSAGTQVARDAAALEAARARVARIELDIDRTEIRAPFAGRLETDAAEIGALLQPGDLCARVVALDPILAVGYAAEGVVAEVEEGAAARIRLLDGRELDGVVAFVARQADAATRTFRIEVSAPNADGAARAGATADIVVSRPPVAAHFLPAAALVLGDDGRLGVRAVEDGRVVFHAVELVGEGRDGVHVAGPPARADIIVQGQAFLVEGAAVDARAVEPGAAARPASEG